MFSMTEIMVQINKTIFRMKQIWIQNSCYLYMMVTVFVLILIPLLHLSSFLTFRHFIISYLKCEYIDPNKRLNCYPLDGVTEEKCSQLKCCYDGSKTKLNSEKVPCYFSKDTRRYELINLKSSANGLTAVLNLVSTSGFDKDMKKLKLVVKFCSEDAISIKITDFTEARYEVPLKLNAYTLNNSSSLLYDVSIDTQGILQVVRKSSKTVIFMADLTKLIFSDQFLQISSLLPSHDIYGLAGHLGNLRKNTFWTKYTFFNRDEIPKVNMNLYSSFPFYLLMEDDGKSHGVYLFNSNAIDVILQPAPAITFRTVGGILDFFVFMGPLPNEVVKQYTNLIGLPVMPPYWSLGFHLCRLGYFTLNNTIQVWNRTINAGIPFDTQWNDIDVMDRYNDFTYDQDKFENLPAFVEALYHKGMHYVLIVDPGISSAEAPGTYPPFDDGLVKDIFVKNISGELLQTKVWNKVSSVFPDFTNPVTPIYWKKQLSDFHNIIPFDGIWLDMNEPTNFLNGSFAGCPEESTLENPQYVPGGQPLNTKTICMTARHYISWHYNIHNVYGTYQTQQTYEALIDIHKKRPFVLTRAGFSGIGQYAAMWNGDMISIWEHLQYSIPSILGYSMNGIPFIGADICGFNDNTTVELCARWFSVGAFYPFCRNHNSDENLAQDPVALGPVVVEAAKTALSVRYFLLPYLYTLFFDSHTHGDTVARPLFFEFPNDKASYAIDRQFLWGPALMIIPVLDAGITSVTGYFPSGIWYDFYTGKKLTSRGQNYTLDAPITRINLLVRGGYILPAQEANQTTSLSRNNKFVLIVALDFQGNSNGRLFWDDGYSLDIEASKAYNLMHFDVRNSELKTSLINKGFATMTLGEIKIFGIQKVPEVVLVNGQNVSFEYNTPTQVLIITELTESLLQPLLVTW